MSLKQSIRFAVSLLMLAVVGLTFMVVIAQGDVDTEALIENALSAAPHAIAEEAAVVWTNDAGEAVVLKEGTNGWTCIPDWTASPGNDPACYDTVWMAWNDAFALGEAPEITEVGIAYMLQGGSDPSNTDPMLMEPAEGEEWVATPPHIMVLLPSGMDLSMISTDHMAGVPYVMWAGTPFQHIMVPISEEEMDH